MQSILITGAAGFLGKELVSSLRTKSIYRIITTDLRGDLDYIGDLSDPNFVRLLPEVNIVINCAAVQYASKTLPFFLENIILRKIIFRRWRICCNVIETR